MRRVVIGALLLLVAVDPVRLVAQVGGQGGAGFPQGRVGRGPARDVRDRPTGTAVIRGRIVTADSGAAIRRAQVRAVSVNGGDTRLVTTDAQGNFEFRDLPAGRWELTASKAGFVTVRFGQRRALEAGRPIEIADGQVVDRINFSLPRGAAITGRVLDEFGDPVAGARVQAMRYQLVQGTRRLVSAGVTAQSDDTGAFRLYSLMPGDYYVSAMIRPFPLEGVDDPSGYAPTYYPGTGNVSEAQAISLAVSQEASITFALMPVRTARVSGRVVNSTGAPLTNGTIMLAAADSIAPGPLAFGSAGRVRPDGSFLLTNVAPGSYRLTATSGGPGGFGGAGGFNNGELELGSIPITIAGEDLTGITLVTSRGATLSGVVGTAQGSTGKLQASGLQVTAQPVAAERGFGPAGGARPVRVENDGTFTLSNLFGPRLIRINGLSPDWTLDGVFIGGSDVTDTPIDFEPNQRFTDVQIVLTDRITQIAGTVTGRDGKPSRDFTVVIFPDDEIKWASPSRYLRTARPDQDGLFKIRALPPDDGYLAVAVDYLEQGEGADPEFLASVKVGATRFRLGAGESATVNLKLVQR
jgi:carboxypeptidase family protein